ncbi:MAG TPA: ABC transporter transmembrane domain-containing protein, partial [Mycobacterium sp.]|nr:ABC transporter transmembrane domain-containing protein [Mycobacterium sp.]
MKLIKLLLSVSRAPVVAVFAAGLVSGVANTYLVFLISRVLAPDANRGVIGFAITGLVALAAGVLSQVLMIRLTQDAIYRLRAQLSSGVLSAPLERLERLGSHRLLATLTEDVQSLSQAVTALPNFCVDVVTIIGCMVFLGVVSGPIFAVTVAGTAASILGVEMVLRRVRRLYREARES